MGFSFDTYLKQYYLVWGVLIGLFVFSKIWFALKIGRALLAVAASEDAASSVGINVPRIKLEIFVLVQPMLEWLGVFSPASCPSQSRGF